MSDTAAGLWRVWVRQAPGGFFQEAFKDCAKRADMERTVRLCKMHQRDIKVMNISTWTMLTGDEIRAIMTTSQ